MDIRATLKPGQNGTKRLREKYGDRLLCVRYRYDEETGKRYTTVELIEEEVERAGEAISRPHPPVSSATQRLGVKVEYWETELRNKIKTMGAIWRPNQKLWEMGADDVIALGLEARVVPDDGTAAES